MTSPFAKSSGGGKFFEAKSHTSDLAIIIEAKRINRNQKHVYEGVEGTRDVAIADIAAFRDSADIANQTPSYVEKDVSITSTILVADIERNGWLTDAGETVPAITVIRKNGRAYVYRNEVTPEAEAAAVAWFQAREGKKQANLDDMPEI